MKTYPVGKPTKMPSGKYQWFQRYRDPLTGKVKKVSCILVKNTTRAKADAEKILAEKLHQVEVSIENSNITFGRLSEKYVEYVQESSSSVNTLRTTKAAVKYMSKTIDGDILASNMTKPYITKWLQSQVGTVANGTIKYRKAILSSIFNYGIDFGYLKENPVLGVRVRYADESEKLNQRIENKYLTDEELEQLMDYFHRNNRDDFKNFFTFLYLTGMRFGEAASLQDKDIKDGYADVNGTLYYNENGSFKSSTPKTQTSSRRVYLPKQALAIVKWFQASRPVSNVDGSSFIFYNKRSLSPEKTFLNNTCNDSLAMACKKLGWSKHVTTHYFRHTHVSKLAEQGIPLEVIQQRVGHSNSEITREIYLHITQKERQSMESKIRDMQL